MRLTPSMMYAADNADADGQKRDDDANRNVPEDDRRPRLPDEMKYRRNILEGATRSAQALAGLGRKPFSVPIWGCEVPLNDDADSPAFELTFEGIDSLGFTA